MTAGWRRKRSSAIILWSRGDFMKSRKAEKAMTALGLFLWFGWRVWLGCLLADLRPRAKLCGRQRGFVAPVFCRGRRKPDWVVRELVRLKARMPEAGCRKVADTFNRCFAARRRMTVSKSYVVDVLRRERHAIAEERKRMKRRKPFDPSRNELWAIDLTGKQDAGGRIHSILGMVDHGTRRLLSLNVSVNKCAWTLLGHVFLAIGKYGKPRVLRSDNERVLTGRVFQLGMRLAGIRHQRTELGCPWQNGRIERVFGTLKNKLNQWRIADKGQLTNALARFAFWYNEVRPHENLKGRTPLEAWEGIDPYRSEPKRAEWFAAWDGLLTGVYLRR